MSKSAPCSMVVLAMALASVCVAQAGELEPERSTVQVVHQGKIWEPGRALGICVQTGLRQQPKRGVGVYTLEYNFTMKHVDRVGDWAETSFMLVGPGDNLMAIATALVRGSSREEVEDRAVKGVHIRPSDGLFATVCGELTNTQVKFLPREPEKPKE